MSALANELIVLKEKLHKLIDFYRQSLAQIDPNCSHCRGKHDILVEIIKDLEVLLT